MLVILCFERSRMRQVMLLAIDLLLIGLATVVALVLRDNLEASERDSRFSCLTSFSRSLPPW
jgi:hypothetical protein